MPISGNTRRHRPLPAGGTRFAKFLRSPTRSQSGAQRSHDPPPDDNVRLMRSSTEMNVMSLQSRSVPALLRKSARPCEKSYGRARPSQRASPPIEEGAAGALFDSPLCFQKRKLGTKSPETVPTTLRLTTISDPGFRLWPAWPSGYQSIQRLSCRAGNVTGSQHVCFCMHMRVYVGFLSGETVAAEANSVSDRSRTPTTQVCYGAHALPNRVHSSEREATANTSSKSCICGALTIANASRNAWQHTRSYI